MSLKDDNRHAQTVMRDLGIKYQMAVPQSIFDSWWFFNCENIPDELPEYIEELKVNPIDCIGHGLDEKMAKDILKRMDDQKQ